MTSTDTTPVPTDALAPCINPTWEKIAARVERITESGCWVFMGALTSKGYGNVLGSDGANVTTHRASYEHHFGPVPNGLLVCHECDVKCCVNPDHLYAGTRADNAQDALMRGQMPTGTRNGASRHSDEVVRSILVAMKDGKSRSTIATEFGVSYWTVRDICLGRRRAHGIKEQ